MATLYGRDLLTLKAYSASEINELLLLAAKLKRERQLKQMHPYLQGKSIALLFDKASTRTRCAFEVAAYELGGFSSFIQNSHLGHKEFIADTAQVLSRYYQGIEFRGFAQQTIEELAANANVPVWNGLTDEYHPTQALADCLTIQEECLKPWSAIKVVFVGDVVCNTAVSLRIACEKLGMTFVGLGPEACWQDLPSEQTACFTSDIESAVADADILYTDVWVSMGEEIDTIARIKRFAPFQVNAEMMAATNNPQTKFMHCLPALHDLRTEVGQQVHVELGLDALEVSDDVFKSSASVVFQQAENRLHTIKAVMVASLVETINAD